MDISLSPCDILLCKPEPACMLPLLVASGATDWGSEEICGCAIKDNDNLVAESSSVPFSSVSESNCRVVVPEPCHRIIDILGTILCRCVPRVVVALSLRVLVRCEVDFGKCAWILECLRTQ
jgi:hypothetical protein